MVASFCNFARATQQRKTHLSLIYGCRTAMRMHAGHNALDHLTWIRSIPKQIPSCENQDKIMFRNHKQPLPAQTQRCPRKTLRGSAMRN